jgi:CheY-like chemotaxis protein
VEKIKTALIVEDNPLNMNLIKIMLKKLEIECIDAITGEEALRLAEKSDADFLLVDINLGHGISGITFMEKIRDQKKYSDTPIIAVTAYSFRELQEYFSKEGFTDYIGKPFKYEELERMLHKNS